MNLDSFFDGASNMVNTARDVATIACQGWQNICSSFDDSRRNMAQPTYTQYQNPGPVDMPYPYAYGNEYGYGNNTPVNNGFNMGYFGFTDQNYGNMYDMNSYSSMYPTYDYFGNGYNYNPGPYGTSGGWYR